MCKPLRYNNRTSAVQVCRKVWFNHWRSRVLRENEMEYFRQQSYTRWFVSRITQKVAENLAENLREG